MRFLRSNHASCPRSGKGKVLYPLFPDFDDLNIFGGLDAVSNQRGIGESDRTGGNGQKPNGESSLNCRWNPLCPLVEPTFCSRCGAWFVAHVCFWKRGNCSCLSFHRCGFKPGFYDGSMAAERMDCFLVGKT